MKEGQLERDVKLARSQARLRMVVASALAVAGVFVFLATLLGFLSMRRSRDRIRAARDQLATANVSLEKALKAKTEFLATTSHEIRTPLNGILGMTQVALADPTVKGPVRERLSLVQTAGETMKMLVDDLLDVAKTEDGALALHAEVFSLRDLLRETQKFWADRASEKGLYLKLESEAPDRVVADRARMRQVLYNLLSNAIKFTDRGGVRPARVLRRRRADARGLRHGARHRRRRTMRASSSRSRRWTRAPPAVSAARGWGCRSARRSCRRWGAASPS